MLAIVLILFVSIRASFVVLVITGIFHVKAFLLPRKFMLFALLRQLLLSDVFLLHVVHREPRLSCDRTNLAL